MTNIEKYEVICSTKAAFEAHLHELLQRPNIGAAANNYTETLFIDDLAEDGWPDAELWQVVWHRLCNGIELTPRERLQALMYYEAGEDMPADEYRLKAEDYND